MFSLVLSIGEHVSPVQRVERQRETEREEVNIVAVSDEKGGGENTQIRRQQKTPGLLLIHVHCTLYKVHSLHVLYFLNKIIFPSLHDPNTTVRPAWLLLGSLGGTRQEPVFIPQTWMFYTQWLWPLASWSFAHPSFLLHFFVYSNKYLGDSSRGDFSNDIAFSIRK